MSTGRTVTMDKHQRIQAAKLSIQMKSYPIFKGVNTVGRNKSAVIDIKHLSVSQNQAVIVIVDDHQHYVSDLGSSNGTFLHGSQLVPFKLYELTNEAEIKFGTVVAKYYKPTINDITINLECSNMEMTQNITQSLYGADTQIYCDRTTENFDVTSSQNAVTTTSQGVRNAMETTSLNPPVAPLFKQPQRPPPFSETKEATLVEENIHGIPTQPDDYELRTLKEHGEKIVKSHEVISAKASQEQRDIVDSNGTSQEEMVENDNEKCDNDGEYDLEYHEEVTQACDSALLQDDFREQNKMSSNVNKPDTAHTDESTTAASHEIGNDNNNKDTINKPRKSHHLRSSIGGLSFVDDSFNDTNQCHSNVVIEDSMVEKSTTIIDDNIDDDDDSNNSDDLVAMPLEIDSLQITDDANPPSDDIDGAKADVASSKGSPPRTETDSNKKLELPSINSDSETDIENTEDVLATAVVEDKEKPFSVGSGDSATTAAADTSLSQVIRPVRRNKVAVINSDSETDIDDNDDDEDDNGGVVDDNNVVDVKGVEEQGAEQAAGHADHKVEEGGNVELSSDTQLIRPVRKSKKLTIESDSEESCDDDGDVSVGGANIDRTKTNMSLNDTDCIPATQDAFSAAFNYKTLGEGSTANGSSEESFKLGLTELMVDGGDSIQDGDEKKTTTQKDNSKESDSKVALNEENAADAKECETKDVDVEENVANIQKLSVDQHVGNIVGNNIEGASADEKVEDIQPNVEEATATTNAPIVIEDDAAEKNNEPVEDVKDDDDDDDEYMMPTQKIETEPSQFKVPSSKKFTFKKKTVVLEQSMSTMLNVIKEDDMYIAPTQKICDSQDIYMQATQNMNNENVAEQNIKQTENNDDDVYLQPTQEISWNKSTKDLENEDQDEYLLPTQLIHDNMPMKGQSAPAEDQTTTDEYDAPTQLINYEPIQNVPQEQEMSTTKTAGNQFKRPLIDCTTDSPKRHKRVKKADLKTLQQKLNQTDDDDAETLSQIAVFVQKPLDEIKVPDDKKKPSLTLRKATRANESATCETLSQIEAFVKQPLPKEEKEKTDKDTQKKGTENAAKPKRRGRKYIKDDSELLDNDTRGIYEDTNDTINNSNETTLSLSNVIGNKEQSFIDQSFAMHATTLNATSGGVVRRTSKTLYQIKVSDAKRQSMDLKDVANLRKEFDGAATAISSSSSSSSLLSSSTMTSVARKSSRNINNNVSSSAVMNKSEVVVSAPAAVKRKRRDSSAKSADVVPPQKAAKVNEKVSTDVAPRASSRNSKSRYKRYDDIVKTVPDAPTKTDKNISSKLKNEEAVQKREESVKKSRKSTKPPTIIEESVEKPSRTRTKNIPDEQKEIVMKTPRKSIRPFSTKVDERAHSTDDSESSPRRSTNTPKRKQKPKVVFTMMDDPHLESKIRQLGGSIVDSIDSATVLVTQCVKRSQKLLAAVGLGKPICSPSWIEASKKTNDFLDPWDFILVDKEAEKKWNFSLKVSLERATKKQLLENYTFQLMVTKATDVLKSAIEACGGKCVLRYAKKLPEGNLIVVATPEDKKKYDKIVKQNPEIKVIEPEAIFDGVLRQELRLSKHLLS